MFKKIWNYLWPQMRKYQGIFYALLLLFIIRVIFSSVLRQLYFKKIIDILSSNGASLSVDQAELFKLVYILIGIIIIVMLSARTGRSLYFKFTINVMRDLRDFAFQKIEQNSSTFFLNTFAGSLVTKSRRFVVAFERMMEIFTYNFLSFFIILVGTFVVLINESRTISLIFFGFVALNILGISFFIRKKMKYDLLEAEQDSRISGRLADVFSNILAVKFFSARDREIESFGRYTSEGARRSRQAWFFRGRIEWVQNIFSVSIQIALLYTMILLWLRGEISTGTVVLVQSYMVLIGEQLWEFTYSITAFMKSAADMKEMVDIFEVQPDVLDPENPEQLKIKEGHILLQDVSFKYAMGGKILTNFNLDIKPGERIGIVGHSGAGKSTLTKILLRFNDIISGRIVIDGQDIKNVRQADLRQVISYVPQEPILFHRSIKENIAYGRPEAAMEEMVDVARKSHAHEFISRLPKGYDTMVGERGVKLSGGERQRVAIARAMLKDSPILILDEATSSLDSVSESYIQDAFNALMKGKTTIVIAHRLSTIQKMDRIIVLDKGKIVEEGTHPELLEKGGVYADLWEHQTGGFLNSSTSQVDELSNKENKS